MVKQNYWNKERKKKQIKNLNAKITVEEVLLHVKWLNFTYYNWQDYHSIIRILIVF